jgi:hypothetical protein
MVSVVFTFSQEDSDMGRTGAKLRCATFKLSEQTRERIEQIRLDRINQENLLFGFASDISKTDVLRFLIDQEINAMAQRAAAAAAAEDAKQAKQAKSDRQRQRRQAKKRGAA